MKNFISFLIIIFMFCISLPAYSQFGDEMLCGEEDGQHSLEPPFRLPNNTSAVGEALRIAIIYVTFPDDNNQGYGYTFWQEPTFFNPPQATQPSIPLVDAVEGDYNDPSIDRYSAYTLSDFFCEMSLGELDVIGEEYKVILPEPTTYYKNLGTTVGQLNYEVLGMMDSQIDYSDYDNWSYNSTSQEWEFGSDGTAEMIIIVYRNVPNNDSDWFFEDPGIGGKAQLLATRTLDNTLINGDDGAPGYSSGVTVIAQLHHAAHTLQLIEHEITHRWIIFHQNVGFFPKSNRMTSYCYFPSEREMAGFQNIPNAITSSTIVTLNDYIATGDMVRVNIPGTDDYYVLANHQRFSEYDGIAKGGEDCWQTNYSFQSPPCETGKGLYFHIYGSNCSNLNAISDIVSAEGRYNWVVDRLVDVPPQPSHLLSSGYQDYPLLVPSTGDRINGKDEYRKWIYSDKFLLVNDDPCSNADEDFTVAWDEYGDDKDPFKMGYDEIFSPYSNPSTSTCNNSTNKGLTFAITGESHGTMTVKIYINDDVQALLDLPPSKPKNIKPTKVYVQTGRFHPKIIWDPNIEPDFDSDRDPGEYKILRGFTTNCEAEPTNYNLIATLNAAVTEYTDNSVYLYDEGAGSGVCEYNYGTYHYKIIAVDKNNDESLPSERVKISGWLDPCAPEERPGNFENDIPSIFALEQNYPNPFNPTTNIQYDIPNDVLVNIKVYDMLGREVVDLVNEVKNAGRYIVGFNGSNLASGIYYYKIKAGNFEQTRRMVLIK